METDFVGTGFEHSLGFAHYPNVSWIVHTLAQLLASLVGRCGQEDVNCGDLYNFQVKSL